MTKNLLTFTLPHTTELGDGMVKVKTFEGCCVIITVVECEQWDVTPDGLFPMTTYNIDEAAANHYAMVDKVNAYADAQFAKL